MSGTSRLAIFDSAQSSPLGSVYLQERKEQRNEELDEGELQRCRPDGFLVWFQVETAGQSFSASAKHNTQHRLSVKPMFNLCHHPSVAMLTLIPLSEHQL